MKNLKQLKPFYNPDYDLNFRSIVLIRDPRSIYHSRKALALNHLHLNRWQTPVKVINIQLNMIDFDCKQYVENYHLIKNEDEIRLDTLFRNVKNSDTSVSDTSADASVY